MIVFWSIAAVMVMMALLFVLPPLLRNRKTPAITQDDLNTRVIKDQLAELDTDLAVGKLDKAQYDAARRDLECELLYDLDSTKSVLPETSRGNGRWLTLLLIPAIPLCAVLLYQLLGSSESINVVQQPDASQQEPANTQAKQDLSLDKMAERLAQRLENSPDDLQGWVMLAKTYKVMRRHNDAIRAYENIVRLGGDNDSGTLADYADALVMTTNGDFTDEAGKLLLRALALQPDNVKALWLTGHWKNQSVQYAEAIRYWQRAAALLPDNSQDKPVITRQIQQAQQKLGITANSEQQAPALAADVSPVKSSSGATLLVHVSLDPTLITKTDPEDTVFIFARAVQGPRMPLAIARKQVKDLPVSVILDDSMAMSDHVVLSNFDQVKVGARISKSGDAMPGSGDLHGYVSPVNPATTGNIEIIINNVMP